MGQLGPCVVFIAPTHTRKLHSLSIRSDSSVMQGSAVWIRLGATLLVMGLLLVSANNRNELEEPDRFTRADREYRPLQFGKRGDFRPLQFGKKDSYRPLQFGKRGGFEAKSWDWVPLGVELN